MKRFTTPISIYITMRGADGTRLEPRLLSFHELLTDVVLIMPYWRSSAGAARQGEELLEQADKEADVYVLRDATHEALEREIKMQQTNLAQSAHLIRPLLRYLQAVDAAESFVDAD